MIQIKESEAEFKSVLDHAPVIIWVTDNTGQCVYLNRKWNDFTGKSIHEGLGDELFSLIHPEDKPAAYNEFIDSMNRQTVFRRTLRYRGINGKYKLYNVDASPRLNDDGQFMGFVGVMQPHSALTSAFNLVDTGTAILNQKLSSFISIASHDLREPIRKIVTFSNLIKTGDLTNLSDKGKHYLSRIQSASQRMTSLLDDLVIYSKIDLNDEPYTDVDLNLLVVEISQELSQLIQSKNAILHYPTLPVIHTVPSLFSRMMTCVIENAVKFSKTGTTPDVYIEASQVYGVAVQGLQHKPEELFHHLSVRDNGIGFNPRFQTQIFEIFSRLNGKSEYEGTGVGLALCKRIAEKLDGLIVAEGIEQTGATIHIYIPVAS